MLQMSKPATVPATLRDLVTYRETEGAPIRRGYVVGHSVPAGTHLFDIRDEEDRKIHWYLPAAAIVEVVSPKAYGKKEGDGNGPRN